MAKCTLPSLKSTKLEIESFDGNNNLVFETPIGGQLQELNYDLFRKTLKLAE